MKKVLALLLVLVMALSLIACNSAANTTASSSPSASTEPSAVTASTEATPPADSTYTPGYSKVGWFDPNGDYYNRDPYKIMYLTFQTGSFGALINDNFKGWASITNVDYATADAVDMDKFYNLLETYATQGIDGFILDGDPSVGERTVELTKELGITAWTTATSALRNTDGSMLWAGVTMDSKGNGTIIADWLYKNYQTYFGADVKLSDIGYIHVDYSVIPNVHEEEVGVVDYLKTVDFNMDQYFNADAAGKTFEADTAYNLVSTILAGNPDIKYWLLSSCCEPYGAGASRAVEDLGKTSKNAIVLSQDGFSLFSQWDAGYNGTWVGALTCPMQTFTNPIMLGVIAMIDGTATAESLWPDYKAAGDKYPNLIVDPTLLTVDNYKRFLVDLAASAPFKTEK